MNEPARDAVLIYEWHVAGAPTLDAIRLEVTARSAEGWELHTTHFESGSGDGPGQHVLIFHRSVSGPIASYRPSYAPPVTPQPFVAPPPPPSVPPAVPAQIEDAAGTMAFCRECGALNYLDAYLCGECGRPLGGPI